MPEALARAVRSGLIESYHDGAVAVIGPDDEILFVFGDIDRPFFLRSSIKPFQATISIEAGASLNREQTALATASHAGQPVHVAVVRSILDDAGLGEEALQCPPAWPPGPGAKGPFLARGISKRIFHNCSGKHAAALAACVAQGWPIDNYTAPDHPYQRRVLELLADVTDGVVEPIGVDGCGFPTLRGSVLGLSRAFNRLATDGRYEQVLGAMMAMPALTDPPGELR